MEVAKAVIFKNNKYLFQLRDDDPKISYPNYWSFFGGEIEPGETPWQALQREVEEELEWRPRGGTFLFHWINTENPCRVHFFAVPFTGSRKELILNEGQSYSWFTLNELKHMNSVVPDFELVNKLSKLCKDEVQTYGLGYKSNIDSGLILKNDDNRNRS